MPVKSEISYQHFLLFNNVWNKYSYCPVMFSEVFLFRAVKTRDFIVKGRLKAKPKLKKKKVESKHLINFEMIRSHVTPFTTEQLRLKHERKHDRRKETYHLKK